MSSGVTALLLTFSYAVAGVLLLLMLVRLRVSRWLAVSVIAGVTGCYFIVFFALQGLRGWSAPVAVPERFQVLWTRIVEPNAALNRPGAIHLWLEEIDGNNIPSGVPRAYILPYSSTLATSVANAQVEIKKGNRQGGRAQHFGQPVALPEGLNVRTVQQGGPVGGDASGGGILDPTALGGQSKSVDLIALPPPSLPPKGDPVLSQAK